ncbi:hypothetical protein BCR37DRAFT_378225 [Protomyces lactucae-debilis]|uniref:HIG1 domain-containing protein n=1 Tax=Protomyces lactucae-debilis TaxID=2754530 RepID=A0A1Y2FNC0_PROLT|nr:uncharacterized protein BCR37DRAFT_378225 [Protomyces lactucae-debilis]ORY84225.1 hypothetical protein BCR37DRAFT_378225 [Protomyces lactucae-debilis]
MKVLSKQEEDAHFHEVVKGGLVYGGIGAAISTSALMLGRKYSPGLRSLTIPFSAFLVTGGSTFALIIGCDQYSRAYQQKLRSRYAEDVVAHASGSLSPTDKILSTINKYRWHIIGGSWVAGMAGSLSLVSRNKYLSGPQKLVQARMYAQGITLAVLLLSAGVAAADPGQKDLGEDSEVTDPNDPTRIIKVHHTHKESFPGENQWEDIVAVEDARLKKKQAEAKARENAKKEA